MEPGLICDDRMISHLAAALDNPGATRVPASPKVRTAAEPTVRIRIFLV